MDYSGSSATIMYLTLSHTLQQHTLIQTAVLHVWVEQIKRFVIQEPRFELQAKLLKPHGSRSFEVSRLSRKDA
jgi:hypothetical protein